MVTHVLLACDFCTPFKLDYGVHCAGKKRSDSRPDMVVQTDHSITLIMLTIPFELGIEDAALRNNWKYAVLLARCAATTHDSCLLTLEVGSTGFLNTHSFDRLAD